MKRLGLTFNYKPEFPKGLKKMLNKKLEKEIEQPFADWVNNQVPNWICVKFEPVNSVGWPDRLLLGPNNKHFFIEFKQPGELLEPLQAYVRKTLIDMGHLIYVCESTDDAKKILLKDFHAAPVPRSKH